MGVIVLLVLLGVFFLVAELVFLPGAVLGAILALASDVAAIYMAFARYGVAAGATVVGIILVLALLATIFSLRAKTWQRFALKDKVEGRSTSTPSSQLNLGDRGVAISRLSPMGKVEIAGDIYEAKSMGAYVDQRSEVEVVGFENFTVVVKPLQK